MPQAMLPIAILLTLSAATALPASEQAWAFTPVEDAFGEEALLDLRSLNEAEAGEHGWLTTDGEGGFLRGDGEPIRFWAITSNRYFTKRMASLEDMRAHARAMAKRGVNMVRFHMTVAEKGAPLGEVDPELLQQFFKLFTALKEEGIYSTVSPYWAHAARKHGENWADEIDGENVSGVLFYHERLQAAYKDWLRVLLTTENPHTGVPLVDDPAFGIFQIQNEDSLSFWTVKNYSEEQRAIFEQRYAEWLREVHGSLADAIAAWDGFTDKGDAPEQGVVKLLHIWDLTQDLSGGKAARAADQNRFLAEMQRRWHEEVERFMREDLDCPVLINAGNWRTADEAKLLGALRWSYEANEVIAKNNYFGSPHHGPKSGYRVLKGHHFQPRSGIRHPYLLPMARRQVAGHPFIIPETLWSPPNPYQAEGTLLTAAYQSLSGVDAHYWFCSNSDLTDWSTPSNGKWFIGSPTMLGQFPAAALLYRRGDVQRGEPAVHERRTLAELWNREPPRLLEGSGYDPNRDDIDTTLSSMTGSDITPLAYAVGPVLETFVEDEAEADDDIVDLDRYIDTDAGRVTSITGELVCDYEHGLFTATSPRAQAAAGWLRDAGAIELADCTLTSENDFAAITVISLDDRPLSESGSVLVQMGTTCHPKGWRVEPTTFTPRKSEQELDGFRIVEYGGPPWMVERLHARLELANGELSEAVVLDPNGYPQRTFELERTADGVALDLPEDALYVVLR